MTRVGCLVALVALFSCSALADTVLPGLVREPHPVLIELPGGRHVTLEGLLTRPGRPGRFPLVILTHGSPRSEPGKSLEAYQQASPTAYSGPALAFAQRGYAAVSIMRRGFGRSEGPYAEFVGDPCDDTDYLKVARISAEDIIGAVATLRQEPWADPDKVVLLGYSTGGLAVTAAAAASPPGVIGVLDFAGGRGSFRPDEVCSPDRLVEAFSALGHTTRIRSLWIFAENDHYLGIALAHRMFDAFAEAGAPAHLHVLPPYDVDGHLLLLRGSTDLWWPAVEAFLHSLHLPTTLMVDLPPLPTLAPPQVNAACVAFFHDYAAARTDAKAFAINPEGHCGFNITERTVNEAKTEAMKLCSHWGSCAFYAVGQELTHG